MLRMRNHCSLTGSTRFRAFSKHLLMVVLACSSPLISAETHNKPGSEKTEAGVIAYEQGDYDSAREIWLLAADTQNPSAQYNLGQLYRLGRGVEIDYQQAQAWYFSAAEQDHALAQRNLGTLYYFGRLGPPDYEKAYAWLLLAANHYDAQAQWMTGAMLYNGEGIQKDILKAYLWLSLASEQNHQNASSTKKQIEQELTAQQLQTAQELLKAFKESTEAQGDVVVSTHSPPEASSQGDTRPIENGPSKYRIQVGAYQTEKNAQAALIWFQQAVPILLDGLGTHIEAAYLGPTKGTLFRLQLGAFKYREDAVALCNKLQKKNHSCSIVELQNR